MRHAPKPIAVAKAAIPMRNAIRKHLFHVHRIITGSDLIVRASSNGNAKPRAGRDREGDLIHNFGVLCTWHRAKRGQTQLTRRRVHLGRRAVLTTNRLARSHRHEDVLCIGTLWRCGGLLEDIAPCIRTMPVPSALPRGDLPYSYHIFWLSLHLGSC